PGRIRALPLVCDVVRQRSPFLPYALRPSAVSRCRHRRRGPSPRLQAPLVTEGGGASPETTSAAHLAPERLGRRTARLRTRAAADGSAWLPGSVAVTRSEAAADAGASHC